MYISSFRISHKSKGGMSVNVILGFIAKKKRKTINKKHTDPSLHEKKNPELAGYVFFFF